MLHKVIIEPEDSGIKINLKELFQYRELIGLLAWRDIMEQYKQAFFGIAWSVVRPVFSVLVFTLVFGKMAKLSSSGIPYPLFTLCGVVVWSFFATSIDQTTVSLLNNANLLTKVYFPRLVMPIASMGRGAVDFCISTILLFVLMGIYGFIPSVSLIVFPVLVVMAVILTLGIGFFLSALCTKYRDIKFAVPFCVQVWFWITPVAYGIENIPPSYKYIFYLNPMTWIIQGMRWSLLGVGEMPWQKLIFTCIFSLIIFLSGLFFFRKMENHFADII
jgi:lipopolysaccharide transport system permease protein